MEIGEVEAVDAIQECEDEKCTVEMVGQEDDTINAHSEDHLSDENIDEQVTVDHTRIVPINVNSSTGSLSYQTGNQGFTVSVPASNVKIVKVVPLPHARSEVWSYFGFIADDDGEIQDKKKAICKICASTLAYSGNTTNLFTHLKAMHPEANPQKLAPTNRTPRTGKKSGKRKFFELADGSFETGNAITLGSGSSQPSYIIRAVTYSGNESGSSSASLFESETNNTTPNSAQITNNGSMNKSGISVKTVSLAAPVVSNNELGSPSSGTNVTSGDNLPLVSTDDITNAIVNMIVEDCRPICITQSKGFEDLMKLVAPGYKIPEASRLKPMVKRRQREVQRNLILRGLEDE